jgi:hypothetical protein
MTRSGTERLYHCPDCGANVWGVSDPPTWPAKDVEAEDTPHIPRAHETCSHERAYRTAQIRRLRVVRGGRVVEINAAPPKETRGTGGAR